MSSRPRINKRDALRNVRIGVSVSGSEDLDRLGLREGHCRAAIAEIARAVFMAGGNLVWGGSPDPQGDPARNYTALFLDEIGMFVASTPAAVSKRYKSLTVCLPESEHRRFDDAQLKKVDNALSARGELLCLDVAGRPSPYQERSSVETPDVAAALSAMRRYVAMETDARVLVGGKLAEYQGRMPGIVEEALETIKARKPLYVAGGFGGAALAVAQVLKVAEPSWAGLGLPQGLDCRALDELRTAIRKYPPVPDGLDYAQRRHLASTYRPGDIASLMAIGLGKIWPDGKPTR